MSYHVCVRACVRACVRVCVFVCVCVRGLGEGVNKHTSEKMIGIGKLDVVASKQVIKFATPSQPRESPQQENEPGRQRLERHDS